jgi:hypothetical protein
VIVFTVWYNHEIVVIIFTVWYKHVSVQLVMIVCTVWYSHMHVPGSFDCLLCGTITCL